MKLRLLLVLCCALSAIPTDGSAQTAQRFSFQFSGLYNALGGEVFEGVNPGGGLELQFRWNPSAFSIGVGGQATIHGFDDPELAGVELNLGGAFIEPRYVLLVGSDRVAAYVALRLAATSGTFTAGGQNVEGVEITGTTLNAGGGALVRLGNRVNLDLGVTAGSTTWDSDDQGTTYGSGSNVIFRLGLAIGIGG